MGGKLWFRRLKSHMKVPQSPQYSSYETWTRLGTHQGGVGDSSGVHALRDLFYCCCLYLVEFFCLFKEWGRGNGTQVIPSYLKYKVKVRRF